MEFENMEKSYLGDGVYAIFDGYGIELRINDLYDPTDKAYLEPPVAKALIDFYKKTIGKTNER